MILLACACQPGMGDDYPIKPGGDDDQTVTPGGRDAAIPDGNDATPGILGRVCLVSDLRDLTSCSATGAGGLTVTLGTSSATTLANGSFTIPIPLGSSPRWVVSGGAIVPSQMPFGAVPTIPAMPAASYQDLLTSNGVLVVAGEGAVVARVVRAGAPLPGAIATATPAPTYAPSYDGTSATLWDQDATGAHGIVWLTGAAAGSLTISITPPAAAPIVTTVPVADQAITFVTVDAP